VGTGSPKSISVASNAFTLANFTAGTYSNFNITHLGCTGSDASSVTINDPDSPTLLPGLVTEPAICGADGSLAFTSTNLPDGTYSLSFTGAGSPKDIVVSSNVFDLTGLKAGTYSQFSITNAGCTGVFAGSKTLTNPPAATLTAGAISHPTTCAGSDGAIAFNSALGDGSYTLNYVGAGSPKVINISGNAFNINGLSAGNYSNFSITIPGCISSDVVTKTLQDPVILATASNTGPYNESQKIDLNATGGDSYSWTGPNGFFSTLQNPSLVSATPANAGIYAVTISAANNCSATASTQVSVNCSSQSLNYFLVFTDGTPQIIAPMVPNMQVQASNRPMSVIAVTACEQPTVESVYMQITGTTNQWFQTDNDMPFHLHDFYNANNGQVLAPNHYILTGEGYDQDDRLGNKIIGPDYIHFDLLWIGRSITSTTASVNEVCVGTNFSVSAISTNHAIHPFGAGNMYEVYLSDVNGSFMSRTLIGAGTDPSNISCQIPMYLPGSNKYKLMVISTNPIVASEPSVLPLSVIGNDLALKSPIDDINAITENHKSISTIKAENKLTGTAKSAYTAGNFIELKPGFSVENSGVFEARIENGCL
jgi:trimeric autotransporter adhesin